MLVIEQSHGRQSENDAVTPSKSEHHDEPNTLKADRLDLDGSVVSTQKMGRNRGMVLIRQLLRI